MTRSHLYLGLFALAAVGSGALVGDDRDPATATARLPGARAEIDAAAFPSLQAALDAIPAEGGLVRLPAGTFEITEPLILSVGDVTLCGAGGATHIKNLNGDAKPALILEYPQGSSDRKNELWRIRLADFRITGNERSGHGIEARRVNELFIQGVSCSYHGGDGIRLDNCYEDPRICDSLLTYNKQTGLNLIGCHDIVVSANQFEENQDALHCFDGFNLTMTGNALDDHLGHGVIIENTYGSVVTGNMIEECQGTAIILDRDCYGITLSANVIAHDGGGIDLRDAHGCAVSANTFTLIKTHALRVGPASGRIAVAGNSFCDSYIGDGSVKRRVDDLDAGGMVLDGASDVNVAANVFSSVRPQALAVSGEQPVRRSLFAGNIVTDAPSQHAQLSAENGCLVSDNIDP